MMNDRFSAQLRQHLLETANERPADGQLAALVDQVAVTSQRRPLVRRLPGFPVLLGRFPAAVRYGLIAVALVLAAVAGAIIGSAGSTRPSTPFEGSWTAIDFSDGSTLNLYVGAGSKPTIRFEDLHATGTVCLDDQVKVFTADGVGEITDNRLEATFPNGGGCGLETVSIARTFVYDPDASTLRDQDGVIWTRIRGGDGPRPTVPPGRFEGRWTARDSGDESMLTLIVGEGTAPAVQFQDDRSTGGVCATTEVKVFRADGVGEISGNRLIVSYPDGGGCGSTLVPIAGRYDYDAGSDTLRDQDAVIWARVPVGGEPLSTLRPAPTPTSESSRTSGCIDLARGGTYTAPVTDRSGLPGPMSLKATIPRTPVIPWEGYRDTFNLTGKCDSVAPIALFASTATSVYQTSCMPTGADFTTFAEAIARLDTPQGADISARIDLTIDGHPAARYDVTNLSTCPQGFGLWDGTSLGPLETGSVYVIDVDGTLVAIELNRDGSQTPAELEEAYAIVASLQITR